jgi:hypothetical protein
MNAQLARRRRIRPSKRALSTLGLAAVLGLGAGACALPGQLGAAEAANGTPATAPVVAESAAPTPAPVAPGPTTTVAPTPSSPVSGARNPSLWPFASDSPWNTPVGSGAVLESPSGPLTSMVRRPSLPSKDGSYTSNMTTWINAGTYSHPVVWASASDPLVTLTSPDPAMQVRIPANAQPAAGGDAHLHVVQPDGKTLIEMWLAKKTSATSWSAGRVEVVDLTGSGLGPDNGVRAYGGSAVGGLIRRWEVDPSDPNYTDGVIRHAVAIALPSGMLRYSGGNAGYDANGYGTAKGYVWPATEQDYDSPWSYYGNVPMGTLFTIPKSVNLDSLGLTPRARALAKAVQDYGAYVTDRTGDGTVAFYAEPSVPDSWFTDVTGPYWSSAQLTTIRTNLVAVTNNSPSSVGGGGTRPIAPAPALG